MQKNGKTVFCLKMISVDEDDNDDKVAAAPLLSSLHMTMFLAEDGRGGGGGEDVNRNMSKSQGWTLQSSLLMLWMEKT